MPRKINTNPVKFNRNLWAYPSRSGKSLEVYVRGLSAAAMDHTTLSFRVSFAKLRRVEQAIRKQKSGQAEGSQK